MRVNIYAEEITDKIEIIEKEIDGNKFTALRFYLELPVTVEYPGRTTNVQGPFMHREGDNDSAAVTFWGKVDIRKTFYKAIHVLNAHFQNHPPNVIKVTLADGEKVLVGPFADRETAIDYMVKNKSPEWHQYEFVDLKQPIL